MKGRENRRVGQRPTSAVDAVEEAVRAVVAHDDQRLLVLAPDTGDLYHWTRDYGAHGTVELVIPPGPAAEWEIQATDMADGGKHVAAVMWTKQEGHSDLTLELELREAHPDRWNAQILGLHLL
jgi:hypothetical protein